MYAWWLLVGGGIFAAAQQAPEAATFRSTAEFVTVDVEVLLNGQPVTGLRREDFRVFDNGREHPIASFGSDERELDILLLVDASRSTLRIQQVMQSSAARALEKLSPRDRAGIVVFAADSEIASTLTFNRAQLRDAITALPPPGGGTEFNRNILLTAMYLRQQARPGTRRAIVIFTDNLGSGVMRAAAVRRELWEADAILSGLLFPGRDDPGNSDIRPFARATGGDLLQYDGSSDQLALIFERLRARYTLLYLKPDTRASEIRHIKVQLAEAAARRLHGDVNIRARTGYIAGQPGSEARQKLR